MQFTRCNNNNNNLNDSSKDIHAHASIQENEIYFAKKVIDKLSMYRQFSYTKLALTLHSHGKRHAALMILQNEKVLSRQVSTLLSINEP